MSASRAGLSRVSKGPSPASFPKARDEDIDDADDYVDDGGQAAEDIGKSFTFKNALTASEAEALERWRQSRNDDDEEQYPLRSKQRNVTYGDIKQPLQSTQLGPNSEALCIASSSAGNMLAVGGRHGTVQLLNPHTLERMDTIRISELAGSSSLAAAGRPGTVARRGSGALTTTGGLLGSYGEGVVTSVCFRPDLRASRMQNLLLAAQGDAIVHLHVGTRRVVHVNTEEGNRINTLAMRPDGAMYASAGSDTVVRVYDEGTCSLSRTLDHGDGVSTTGHTNCVFSLAWQPNDPQILLSGGWDNRVLVWDMRVHRSVRSISGPHICGDALDVQPGGAGGGGGAGGLVLTGSWRNSNPLQLWDLGSGRLLSNLPWWQPETDGCLIYAARFGTGPAAGTVVAGGSGAKPVVRVYKLNGPGNVDLQYTVRFQRPVHALALIQPPGGGGAAAGGEVVGVPQLQKQQSSCSTSSSSSLSSSSLWASPPVLAVCCDSEVHTVALGAAAPAVQSPRSSK
ncbi:hypothetical protein PLESTF_001275300 [Pleodorina starrii]|nr:hypothetical protein PLESTM_000462200 [Pleodorina starrii]GLC72657.1 hypothetical protein PLESTF_001275300 [Pleodorina starrii]